MVNQYFLMFKGFWKGDFLIEMLFFDKNDRFEKMIFVENVTVYHWFMGWPIRQLMCLQKSQLFIIKNFNDYVSQKKDYLKLVHGLADQTIENSFFYTSIWRKKCFLNTLKGCIQKN